MEIPLKKGTHIQFYAFWGGTAAGRQHMPIEYTARGKRYANNRVHDKRSNVRNRGTKARGLIRTCTAK